VAGFRYCEAEPLDWLGSTAIQRRVLCQSSVLSLVSHITEITARCGR
jgi:hypothetical protein